MTKEKNKGYSGVMTLSNSSVLCLQTALDNFPEISVVTELKKDGETPAFKVRLSGKAYNKKTMKPYKMPNKVPQVRRDIIFGELDCAVNICSAEGAVSLFCVCYSLHYTKAAVPFPVMLPLIGLIFLKNNINFQMSLKNVLRLWFFHF